LFFAKKQIGMKTPLQLRAADQKFSLTATRRKEADNLPSESRNAGASEFMVSKSQALQGS
jgi:hypothetical protein